MEKNYSSLKFTRIILFSILFYPLFISSCNELESKNYPLLLLNTVNENKAYISLTLTDENGNLLTSASIDSRTAAPTTFQDPVCYGTLLSAGKVPSNSDLTVLEYSSSDSKWIFGITQAQMELSGSCELYIYTAGSDDSAKDITKAPLYTIVPINIDRNTVIYEKESVFIKNPKAQEKGSIKLNIKVPDGTDLQKLEFSFKSGESDVTTSYFENSSLDVSSNTFSIEGSDIPAGSYKLYMEFQNSSGLPLYFTTETVDVWAGCTSDYWYGTSSAGDFNITDDILNSTFYVCGDNPCVFGKTITSSIESYQEPSDNNSGGILSPLISLEEALNRILATNTGNAEYYIVLDGTASLSSSFEINDTDFSLNLTVQSIVSDYSKSVIDGQSLCRCLKITGKESNVTFKNVTIQNGSVDDKGAGIYIDTAETATILFNNCKIKNHIVNNSDGGALYIKKVGVVNIFDTEISENKLSIDSVSESGNYGAGICVCKGIVNLYGTSKINDNIIETSVEQNSYGAGIAITNGDAYVCVSGNSIIKNNSFNSSYSCYGGGIYNAGNLTITGGTIISNTVPTGGFGQGVYSLTNFYMKGNPYIDVSNPVYLASGSCITLTDKITSSGIVAYIETEKRVSKIVACCGAISSVEAYKNNFSLVETDAEFDISCNKDYLCSVRPLYVSSTGDDSKGDGSRTRSFATLQRCLKYEDDNGINCFYKFAVDGTISGNQSISKSYGEANDKQASIIYLYGANGLDSNGIPNDCIDGNSENSRLLTIKANKVKITDLKFTNSTGGAIKVETVYQNGLLELSDGVLITGNTAEQGAAVYLDSANLYINGSALIGDNIQDFATETSYGNLATENGGAIWADTTGVATIYLGYYYNFSTNKPETRELTGGICHNYAQSNGGGLYAPKTIYMNSGYVQYNACAGSGGGIYYGESNFSLSGGSINNNFAENNGGGLYGTNEYGQLYMTCGSICNNKSSYGAGIYRATTGSYNTLFISGGNITNNVSTTAYSGIYSQAEIQLSNEITIGQDQDFFIGSYTNKYDKYFCKNIVLNTSLPNIDSITVTIDQLKNFSDSRTFLTGECVKDNYTKFTVKPDADGTPWYINSSGKLTKTDPNP